MYDLLHARCESTTGANGVVDDVAYCAANDTTCARCSVTPSKPTCLGEDGRCLCPSLCTMAESAHASCSDNEPPLERVWLGFLGVAAALPLLLWLQRKCNEPRTGVQHMLYNRHRLREQRRRERARDTTRDLTLSEWRDHCAQHKLEVGEVELKTCYLLLQDTGLRGPAAPVGAAVEEIGPSDECNIECENNSSSASDSPDTSTSEHVVAIRDDGDGAAGARK